MIKPYMAFAIQPKVYGCKDRKESKKNLDNLCRQIDACMYVGDMEYPAQLLAIPEGAICTDAVYNPVDTAFLLAAKRRGARTVTGIGWFVNQGASAWKLWTGTDMPTELVRRKVLEALGAA